MEVGGNKICRSSEIYTLTSKWMTPKNFQYSYIFILMKTMGKLQKFLTVFLKNIGVSDTIILQYLISGYLFVLRFYGPVNPTESCRARSVYLTTHFFLIWVLRPFQEYFTYIEPIVHRRWAKTGEPGEKPPDHP